MNSRQLRKLEAEKHNKAYLESKKPKTEKVLTQYERRKKRKAMAILAMAFGLTNINKETK